MFPQPLAIVVVNVALMSLSERLMLSNVGLNEVSNGLYSWFCNRSGHYWLH